MRLLISLFLLLCSLPAAAAVVHMRDGGRREGTVVGATALELTLSTPEGVLRIPADKILRVEYAPADPPPAAPQAAPEAPRGGGERTLADRLNWPAERNMISFELGLDSPLSDLNFGSIGGGEGGNGTVGPLVGIQYLRLLDRKTGVGFDLGYFHRGGTDSLAMLQSANTNVYGDTLTLLAVLRHAFLDSGPARPYLVLGGGAARNTVTIDATPLVGFAWSDTGTAETRRLVDDDKWGPAGTARVGVEFAVFEPTRFSLEAGWLGLPAAKYGSTPLGQAIGLSEVSGPLNVLLIAARWGWRF